MGRSLVYRSTIAYELIMLSLYGRHYGSRYRAVAGLIADGSSVVDLCCGPGVLFERHLRAKGVAYTGVDLNERFVERVRRMGGVGVARDLKDGLPLPAGDVVVMQASLYQFLPDAASMVRLMLEAARERVIIAEPVRNLSDSRIPLLARFAQRQADAGLGDRSYRFNDRSLDLFFEEFGPRVTDSFLIPGGREKVFILDPRLDRSDAETSRARGSPEVLM